MSETGKVAGLVFTLADSVIDRMLDWRVDPEEVKAALASEPEFLTGDRWMFHGDHWTLVASDEDESWRVLALCRNTYELTYWGYVPLELRSAA